MRDYTADTMQVRCCCVPKKLLGWVPVPPETFKKPPGTLIAFYQKLPTHLDFKDWDGPLNGKIPDPIVLELGLLNKGPGSAGHLALKSMELPIERLRTIVGWQEAEDHQE